MSTINAKNPTNKRTIPLVTPNPKTLILGYTFLSKEEKKSNTYVSIDFQRNAIEDHLAATPDLLLSPERFDDEGVYPYTFTHRLALQRAVHLLRTRQAGGLAFYHTDRLLLIQGSPKAAGTVAEVDTDSFTFAGFKGFVRARNRNIVFTSVTQPFELVNVDDSARLVKPYAYAALYLSVFEEDGKGVASLTHQRMLLEKEIASNPSYLPVEDPYTDEGVSGLSLERPGLTELFCDCVEGSVDCVFVYSLDRLCPTLEKLEEVLLFFEQHKVRLISMVEGFDSKTNSESLDVLLTRTTLH